MKERKEKMDEVVRQKWSDWIERKDGSRRWQLEGINNLEWARRR